MWWRCSTPPVIALAADGRSVRQLERGQRESMEWDSAESQIALVHAHLPKLADAGYIEWDPDSGDIAEGPRFEEVEVVLDLFDTHADDLPSDWP